MKRVIFICIFTVSIGDIFSQNFQLVGEMIGIDSLVYKEQLNEATHTFLTSIPDTTYLDSIMIFSISHYIHSEASAKFLDSSIAYAATLAENMVPYFIILNRISTYGSLFDYYYVDFKLPTKGIFSCINETETDSLRSEMLKYLNDKNENNFIIKEINSIHILREFINRKVNCCGEGRVKMPASEIDTSKLKVLLFVDNCSNIYSPEHSVHSIVNGKMPEIGIKIDYPNYLDICYDIEVFFKIKYQRNCPSCGHADSLSISFLNQKLGDYISIDYGQVQLMNKSWNRVQGGVSSILVKNINGDTLKKFIFTIKGQNPTIGEALKYLDESPFSSIWFYKKMAIHESRTTSNDASSGIKHFNYFSASKEDLENNWDAWSRCPNLSDNCDCGWGLMQITSVVPPENIIHGQVLWDWRANIYASLKILETKYPIVYSRIQNDINDVLAWNNEYSEDQVELLDTLYSGVMWKMGPSNIISNYSLINNYFVAAMENNERSLLDASIILAYNGFGGTQSGNNFIYRYYPNGQQAKPKWTIGDNQNNYVQRISEQVVPAH